MTHRSTPLISLIALLVLGAPAAGQDTLSIEEFQRYVTGKTLFYGKSGQAYGAEQYLNERRVIWSFLDGDCQHGSYYQSGNAICFVYEVEPSPQCWEFRLAPDGLHATYIDPDGTSSLIETSKSAEPLYCPGPKVGA